MPSDESHASVPKKCPACASTEIRPVLETNYGAYWRCSVCGQVWHEDTRTRPKLPPLFECCFKPWLSALIPRRKHCA